MNIEALIMVILTIVIFALVRHIRNINKFIIKLKNKVMELDEAIDRKNLRIAIYRKQIAELKEQLKNNN